VDRIFVLTHRLDAPRIKPGSKPLSIERVSRSSKSERFRGIRQSLEP
jgi:hypothetical protein